MYIVKTPEKWRIYGTFKEGLGAAGAVLISLPRFSNSRWNYHKNFQYHYLRLYGALWFMNNTLEVLHLNRGSKIEHAEQSEHPPELWEVPWWPFRELHERQVHPWFYCEVCHRHDGGWVLEVEGNLQVHWHHDLLLGVHEEQDLCWKVYICQLDMQGVLW